MRLEWIIEKENCNGIGSGSSSDIIKDIIGKIFKGVFKVGYREAYEKWADQFHLEKD